VHNLISNGSGHEGVNLRIISDLDADTDYLQCVWPKVSLSSTASLRFPFGAGTPGCTSSRCVPGTTVSLFRNGDLVASWSRRRRGDEPSRDLAWQHICPGYPTTCPGAYPLIGGSTMFASSIAHFHLRSFLSTITSEVIPTST
jgi:hypothetical protein